MTTTKEEIVAKVYCSVEHYISLRHFLFHCVISVSMCLSVACVCRSYKWWQDRYALGTRKEANRCSFLIMTVVVAANWSLVSWPSPREWSRITWQMGEWLITCMYFLDYSHCGLTLNVCFRSYEVISQVTLVLLPVIVNQDIGDDITHSDMYKHDYTEVVKGLSTVLLQSASSSGKWEQTGIQTHLVLTTRVP